MKSASLTVRLRGPDPKNSVWVVELGQSFDLAGSRCLLDTEVGPGRTQTLLTPAVVNLSLAIELFLKSVIVAGGELPKKTHNTTNKQRNSPSQYQFALP